MTVEVPQIQFLDGGMVGIFGLELGSTVDTWSTSVLGCF